MSDDTVNSSGGLRYLKACAQATHDCGLDIVSAALSHVGVPHVVEQTGGFTMVLYVDARGERLQVAEEDGYWNVYRHDKRTCPHTERECECERAGMSIASGASIADVVRYAERFVNNLL